MILHILFRLEFVLKFELIEARAGSLTLFDILLAERIFEGIEKFFWVVFSDIE